ncbi:MAG: uracil phosphoribosyltransferase, partial [Alphaproteobacteria bacterium]|nr:uracil phosphoribosyltransferase [Alphaproteobacteria bacterium]
MFKKALFLGGLFFVSVAHSDVKAPAHICVEQCSAAKEFPNLTIVTHPLVQHKLTIMRDTKTGTLLFRQLLNEIGLLMGYEVTRSLETKERIVTTPVATAKGVSIEENQVVIVPILRAGLGMAEGLQSLIPTARQGHIGIYRDPETKKAVEYYFKIPPIQNQTFIVVDPMLATGNSAVAA